MQQRPFINKPLFLYLVGYLYYYVNRTLDTIIFLEFRGWLGNYWLLRRTAFHGFSYRPNVILMLDAV